MLAVRPVRVLVETPPVGGRVRGKTGMSWKNVCRFVGPVCFVGKTPPVGDRVNVAAGW